MRDLPLKPKKWPKTKGFALISTLSIVVLLAFIAVGLLSLSSLSLRQAANTKATEQAKVNAKLGLMEALNELQMTMGPDQRVSAYAGGLNNVLLPGVLHPNTLGVWNGWKIPNNVAAAPVYNTAKTTPATGIDSVNGGFVKWLSSGSAANVMSTTTAPLVSPVTLVGANTVGPTADLQVSASRLPIDSDGNGVNEGAYAWHVFDESQKVNLKTKNSVFPAGANALDDLSKTSSLNGVGKPGLAYDPNFASLDTLNTDTLDKVTNLDALGITTPALNQITTNAFYTLTTTSRGVLADVASGGLQKDLSLLFANDTLPAPYSSNHLYSDAATPVAAVPQRFDGEDTDSFVQPLASPDPTWSLLHSHYRLYKDVSGAGGKYSAPIGNTQTNSGGSVTPIYNYGSEFNLLDNPKKIRNNAFEKNQQLLPVVSNAQFIYSLSCAQNTNVNNSNGNVNVVFFTDVVLTLWNPYNVEMDVGNMEFEFYRFPASFSFHRRDKDTGLQKDVSPGDYFHTSNMHNPYNIAGVGERAPWELRDSVPYRVRVKGATLAPGEFRVFGVNNYNDNVHNGIPISNHEASNFTHGMVLENDFNHELGGIYTSPTMFNDDGTWGDDGGWLYGEIGDKVSLGARARMVTNGYGGFKDLNGNDASAYIKIYMGDGGDLSRIETDSFDTALEELYDNGNRIPIGTIVFNSDNLDIVMPDIPVSDTPELELNSNQFGDWKGLVENKIPMVVASLRLKTEKNSADIDSNPRSRVWLNNGITNPYFTNGFTNDQDIDEKNLQYEMTWEPMSDWDSIPAVEIIDGKGYGGSGINSQNGVTQAVVSQVPLAPYGSISQFSHAPLNKSGVAPLTSQVVGNSFASTALTRTTNSAIYPELNTSYLDHSYMANNTLFDGYFLSTAYDETDIPLEVDTPRPLATVLTDFFTGVRPLRNPNFESTVTVDPGLTAANYNQTASYIYNNGAFNVNSTSISAWSMFLSSANQSNLPIFDALKNDTTLGSSDGTEDNSVAFSRFSPLQGDAYNNTAVNSAGDKDRWDGSSRRLSQAQITTLATNIVAEVRARGPFQSLSEFINRRLENSTLADQGALQAAINNSNLNQNAAWQDTAAINKVEADGAGRSGYTSDGSPTYLTQADILNRIAPSITVRGDTFTIRAYGESLDPTLAVNGQAWCEAVVQRTQQYVDATDAPEVAPAALTPTNLLLGRKFKIVSFRWLSQNEI